MKLSIFNNMKKNTQPGETGTPPADGATGTFEVGMTGYDPKNRIVEASFNGEIYKVTKPDTGFEFTGTSEQCKEVFEHQISCSQN